MSNNEQVAILAGGCFWCIEAAYNSLTGINQATSGYIGGHVENPSYEAICRSDTGHAEAVKLHFDPALISYREILEIFFALHDPTQLNRQGNDIGSQYRSEIFFLNDEQREHAEAIIAEMEAEQTWPDPVVTKVSEASTFYNAEDYHQEYAKNNPQNGYCAAVVSPKLAKFKKTFASKLK